MARLREQIRGGILGAVVGDALGLPHEGERRSRLSEHPVEAMASGGPHGRPAGTWSDDSSLLLCLAESLTGGYRPDHVGSTFFSWWREALWTPRGRTFGYGATTAAAMYRMAVGVSPLRAGLAGGGANGNGSLMRTLPIALYFSPQRPQMLKAAHEVSAITHGHPRAQMCCGIYCLVASYLLEGRRPDEAARAAMRYARDYYRGEPWQAEREHLRAVLSLEIKQMDRCEVRSGGYVVETLEAAVWSLLRARGFRNTLLVAVNLGGDTDTVGCVTGGLAGTLHGEEAIPDEWLRPLARRQDIEDLCDRFADVVMKRRR